MIVASGSIISSAQGSGTCDLQRQNNDDHDLFKYDVTNISVRLFQGFYLEAAGKTPINCSSGLKGMVSLSNSFLTLEMLVKSDANGA